MGKISLVVVVVSLVVALPWRWAAGQDDSWKSLADQAASQGISQQSIDDAQAALRGAAADDAESSVWADWIQGNADNMGYTDESAPTASADGDSPSDEPEAEDFADIGVDDSPAVAESPAGTSPTDCPSFAPESQSPAAGADTPETQAPNAATPAAYSPGAPAPTADVPSAAAPEAQTPGAASPGAYAPDAATPVAQETGADSPTLEAEAPGAATSPGASSPDASWGGGSYQGINAPLFKQDVYRYVICGGWCEGQRTALGFMIPLHRMSFDCDPIHIPTLI